MDKRYQVFISSTYSDLKEERSKVMQTVMALDCIPSGMELFTAFDAEQLEFIKKIIDDCDYYILIIGGRYGSMTKEGISYTEEEYNYAVSKGIPVLAFLHKDINELTAGKVDLDSDKQEKLKKFRDKVSSGRLVKFWSSPDELDGLVAVSLTKTIKTHPGIGWIRANVQSSLESLHEINELRKENEKLRKRLKSTVQTPIKIDDIAKLQESITINGTAGMYEYTWELTLTWEKLFGLISPFFMEYINDEKAQVILSKTLAQEATKDDYKAQINLQDFQTIKIQMISLGLFQIANQPTTDKSQKLFWKLSPMGEELMHKLRVIRTSC